MDINQVIQTLLGTVVGGGIVIFTNWINNQSERRKSNREWYERTYITEALDPLIAYFLRIEIHLFHKKAEELWTMLGTNPSLQTSVDSIPIEALARIQVLFDSRRPIQMIKLIEACLIANKQEGIQIAIEAVSKTSQILLDFWQELLKTALTKINSKIYHIDASNATKQLDVAYAALIEELEKGNLVEIKVAFASPTFL